MSDRKAVYTIPAIQRICCLQDTKPAWLHRAQAALQDITTHPANFATLVDASSQAELTQAWRTFTQTVKTASGPPSSAGMPTSATHLPSGALSAAQTNREVGATGTTGNAAAAGSVSLQPQPAARAADGVAVKGPAAISIGQTTAPVTGAQASQGHKAAGVGDPLQADAATIGLNGPAPEAGNVHEDDEEEVWHVSACFKGYPSCCIWPKGLPACWCFQALCIVWLRV